MAYLLRRDLGPVFPVIPEEPGLRAHVFRVAALATRAAELQGWPVHDLQTVERTAVVHHYPVELIDSETLPQLLRDLGVTAGAEGIPRRVAHVLRAFRGLAEPEDELARESAKMIESANLFDEQVENSPYEDRSTEEALDELAGCGILTPAFRSGLDNFQVETREGLVEQSRMLPVFPKAAIEALRIARDPESSASDIERVVSKDPVLAGEIMQVVNSGLFGAAQEVSALGAALARIGTVMASKVIAAAAVRTFYLSAPLAHLWKHALETAEEAARIAGACSKIDPAEAYLAGLVHDVGRIPYETAGGVVDLRLWEEAGFPAIYAELLVSRSGHAALGADILRNWSFPEPLIEAVAFHHSPEKTTSQLAAVLYAAEDYRESLPSCARDHAAAQRLNVLEIKAFRAG